MRLERLRSYRGEEHAIELKGAAGGASHGQVTEMRRVETSSKKGYATASNKGCAIAVGGLHANCSGG